MLVRLDTPYADTTAGDLCFTRDLPERPALYVLASPATGLRLRLLGASHQVALAGHRIETVACLPGHRSNLPRVVSDGGYRFTAEVRRLTSAAMSDAVRELRDRLAPDPDALVGVFPGDADAITALRGEASGAATIRWRTWHAYPQTGELVVTHTEVTR